VTETNLRDTAACSQQLDEALLVCLVYLGIQSAERGNDVRASAGVRDWVQRGSVGMYLDSWAGSSKGPTDTRQGAVTQWKILRVGPGELLSPGFEYMLSGL
jgi:hypothetical protein